MVLIEGKLGEIRQQTGELVVVSLFEGDNKIGERTAALDAVIGGRIQALIGWGDFKGRLGESALLYPGVAGLADRVLLVGLGKSDEFDAARERQVAATVARKAQSLGITTFATVLHGASAGQLSHGLAAQALAEGTILAGYRGDLHRTVKDDEDPGKAVERVSVLVENEAQLPEVESGIRAGQVIASAANWARDLVNQPANCMTPRALADEAHRMAVEAGLGFELLGPEEMRKLGMGALLGVAQGSAEEPRFIVLEHKPQGQTGQPVVFVGKGITFDSGGISLKNQDGMEKMKGDMAGAAAVLAAMQATAALAIPMWVIGLIPATENLPSGTAYRPGDVLTSITGKTIEVISTDAEGRLILADALGYSQRYNPKAVVDLATLTGACVVALGNIAAGLFANDDGLATRVETASRASGEKVWRMPLWREYAEQIKSDVADMKNTGGRPAGAITGAMLLSKFVGTTPWVHLDIAGVSASEKDTPVQPRGATGYGVRLLVQLLRDWH